MVDAKHTQGAVHLLPYTDPTKMLAILTNDEAALLAYVGVKGKPNEANARRIIAAWNACLEIRTEALEEDVICLVLSTAAAILAANEAGDGNFDHAFGQDLMARLEAAVEKANGTTGKEVACG